jgi:hypothetical protein
MLVTHDPLSDFTAFDPVGLAGYEAALPQGICSYEAFWAGQNL